MITGLIGAFGGNAVGRMIGGRTGGMIGSLAGSMLAGKMRSGGGAGGIGDLLGGLMGGDAASQANAVAAGMEEDDAMILVRAMCNAAKADGTVDEAEIDAIVSRAGSLDADDEAMLRRELNSPLDLEAFIAQVPAGMEADVYAASLLPITVDTPSEMAYVQELAQGLGLSAEALDSIHSELGLG
jgi:uncharacterized membrane protein YebE (DUF533 family)